tara:strand:- start:2384 stop:4420 length:2037 start_codon:yes stop_codon:yes gene_type:complete
MILNDEGLGTFETLEGWVMTKCDAWRDHYTANYQEKHDEYYRLWRGQWAQEDSTRASERSRIIAPALQQAVESSVAEVEEATFGRGLWFDIKDDDGDNADIIKLREELRVSFVKNKVRKGIAEAMLNAAIFGTGVGEIVMDTVKDMKPATQDVMGGELTAVGVEIVERTCVKFVPVMPQNFLIDPLAHSIEEALGCAVDKFVPMHTIDQGIEAGIYRDVEVGEASSDFNIEADKDIQAIYQDDKVRLTKYFGLVPRRLLDAALAEDEAEEVTYLGADTAEEENSELVEAVVIIANEGTLLKAEASPYMMADRPVVGFSWDAVPSRFWGRGVCEKGYNSQKALDAELRARIDALALTIHPMMAMDASRMPRGSKPEIRPGKIILTNGNPAEVLQPFNFGNVSQVTFAQADALQRMVQASTGAVDSAGVSGSINGEATAAGMSMSLGALIKRHKRTLINFQESFLIPFVEKVAWRYMQFEPELYPVGDYSFVASSSLGVVAREYEVSQLVQLLQTMQPDSPQYNMIISSVIDNMSLSNREELMSQLEALSTPDPEAQQAQQQAQQAAQQADMEFKASQTAALTAQAGYDNARAEKATAEAQIVPIEAETNRMKAMTQDLNEGKEDAAEFDRRLKLGKLKLDAGKLKLNERSVAASEGFNQKPMAPKPMTPPPMTPPRGLV